MQQPDPRDAAAVLDALRKYGSAQWPATAIPGEFADWRRATRAAARAAGLRVSIRRLPGMVFVMHVDHVVTADDLQAFGKVTAAQLDGTELSWDEALHQAARQRLPPVPRPDAPQ